MAHRNPHRLHPRRGERFDSGEHSVGGAADNRLVVRVDVRYHGVAGRGIDDPLDLGERTEHGGHCTVVLDRQARHFTAPRAHGFESGIEGERTSSDEGAVLAEAVPHHHVRVHPVGAEQTADRGVGGEHRRLGDLGLQEFLFELSDCGGVVTVDEDVRRQRTPEQRGHHRVSLTECVGHDRLDLAQPAQHVDVLRTLPGVQEGHLRCRTAADEDALLTHHSIHGGVVCRQCRERLVELHREIVGVGEVDGDAHRSAPDGRIRLRWCRAATCPGFGERSLDLGDQIGIISAAQHERTTKRWFRSVGHRTRVRRLRGLSGGRRHGCARRGELLGGWFVTTRHVLFHHDVEVGPAEPEHADPTASDAAGRLGPRAQVGVDGERRAVPIDVGVRVVEVEAGRQHLVVQTANHLEHACCAGGRLEMADVRLHRTERNAVRRGAGCTEHLGETGEFGGIANPGGCAVCFDRCDRGRVLAGDLPRPLYRQPLTDRIRRGDALALAIAGARDTEDHGVHTVAVAFGVLEALQDEQRGTFTHDEPVGAGIEGARAGGGEGPDLAELHERRHTHVVVDTPGDGRIEAVIDQPLDRHAQGSQA